MYSETIADIVREMREYAAREERMGIYDLRNLATETLRDYTDRIEAAHELALMAEVSKAAAIGYGAGKDDSVAETQKAELVPNWNKLETTTKK